jgi:hypothetical protein
MIDPKGEYGIVEEGERRLVLRRRECLLKTSTLRDFGKRVLGSSLSASVDKITRNHFQRVLPETPVNGFPVCQIVDMDL